MRNSVYVMAAVIVVAIMAACKESEPKNDFDFVFPDNDTVVEPDEEPVDESPDNDDAALKEGIEVLLKEHLLFTNGAGIAVGIEDARRNKVVTAAAGRSDREEGTALAVDLLFRVASITKMFVATAVLRLTEQEKITLDDKLDKWYPDYPEADRITVRMLLNHTSGISDYAVSGSPEEIIAVSADMPRYFEPGAGWAYSNTNYILLGRIIERVAEETLADFLRREIFEEADLPVTSLEQDEGLLGTLAVGHLYEDDALTTYTADNPAWSDGGIVSSVADLAHFATRLFGGWLLSTAMLDHMLTFVSSGYGLGVMRYENATVGDGYGHNGSLINFNGQLIYFPSIKTAVAIQANYPVAGDNDYLIERIVELYVDVVAPPAADACAYVDLRPDPTADRYETLRFKGTINDINAAEPSIGTGYYYYSGGTGSENLFCNEYAFRYDEGEKRNLYLMEECPEVERYYTGELRIRRIELSVPVSELPAPGSTGAEPFDLSGLTYARIDYWYDTVENRVTKRCMLGLPAALSARFSVCAERNAAYDVGEELRLFAYLPLSEDIPEQQQCQCFDDQGNIEVCTTIEDDFGCTVPENYFAAEGDSFAHYRFVGPINDPAAQIPEEGETEHQFMAGGAFFEASSYNNFAMRADNGLGTEVLIVQSFGDLEPLGDNTYRFKASELVVPVPALVAAKTDSAETLTEAGEFYFGLYDYEQKIRGNEISYKKCFVAARYANDAAASLLPCYADNTDFAVGETLKIFGNMQLVDDPASLGIYWPTTDDCLCFTAGNTLLDCADFDEL